jgi:hypothetical protein
MGGGGMVALGAGPPSAAGRALSILFSNDMSASP